MDWRGWCRSSWGEQGRFFVGVKARVRARLVVDHARSVGRLRPVVVLVAGLLDGFSATPHGWLRRER